MTKVVQMWKHAEGNTSIKILHALMPRFIPLNCMCVNTAPMCLGKHGATISDCIVYYFNVSD